MKKTNNQFYAESEHIVMENTSPKRRRNNQSPNNHPVASLEASYSSNTEEEGFLDNKILDEMIDLNAEQAFEKVLGGAHKPYESCNNFLSGGYMYKQPTVQSRNTENNQEQYTSPIPAGTNLVAIIGGGDNNPIGVTRYYDEEGDSGEEGIVEKQLPDSEELECNENEEDSNSSSSQNNNTKSHKEKKSQIAELSEEEKTFLKENILDDCLKCNTAGNPNQLVLDLKPKTLNEENGKMLYDIIKKLMGHYKSQSNISYDEKSFEVRITKATVKNLIKKVNKLFELNSSKATSKGFSHNKRKAEHISNEEKMEIPSEVLRKQLQADADRKYHQTRLKSIDQKSKELKLELETLLEKKVSLQELLNITETQMNELDVQNQELMKEIQKYEESNIPHKILSKEQEIKQLEQKLKIAISELQLLKNHQYNNTKHIEKNNDLEEQIRQKGSTKEQQLNLMGKLNQKIDQLNGKIKKWESKKNKKCEKYQKKEQTTKKEIAEMQQKNRFSNFTIANMRTEPLNTSNSTQADRIDLNDNSPQTNDLQMNLSN